MDKLCSRGCNRSLIGSEKEVGACAECLMEGTHNKIRCWECGNVLSADEADAVGTTGQLCIDCFCERTNLPATGQGKESKVVKSTGTKVKTYSPPPEAICTHDGAPLVFSIGEGKVFAGGSRDMGEWGEGYEQCDLVITLNPPEELVSFVSHGNIPKALSAKIQKYPALVPQKPKPQLNVKWSDMSAPPFGSQFVKQLGQFIEEGNTVLIHCMGGHGRTGTLLTALAIEYDIWPGEPDKLKKLRKVYCEKAVESASQLNWLVNKMDLETEETSSSTYTTYGTSHFKGTVKI